jgi:hypothetical protein
VTKTLIFLIIATVSAPTLAAAECVLKIDRTPCEGKEAEARKPYAGKNPTEEKRDSAKTAADCLTEGEKASKIVRKGTLAKKVVTVLFDGKEVGKKEDSASCKK